MKQQVAAVVLAHDQPEYLLVVLQALANQTIQPDSVLILDSSTDESCAEVAAQFGQFNYLKIAADSSLPAAIDSYFTSIDEEHPTWMWLLHDDSAPQKTALAELLIAAERSPSVALVGPKQLNWQNPREILQLGLTVTPSLGLFSPHAGQLDQAQHDATDDVLAIGTAAALIKTEAYLALGGFSKNAPALAADIELSIRARLAGYRVMVAPKAKVVHAALSLNGQRPKRWLRTSPRSARRRAEIHLNLNFRSAISAFLFWFFLPLIGLGRAATAIATKRPQRIYSEISSALWGWFTVLARVRNRHRFTRKVSFSKLGALRATWPQVREYQRAQSDVYLHEPEQNDSNSSTGSIDAAKGFASSGAIWIAFALLLLNFSWWPRDIAATGGGVLPLAHNWIDLFNRAGASFQDISIGYFAPSDPFVWVLATFGLTTFWAPSLSLAIFIFAFKAISFSTAWLLSAQLTKSSLARNLAALSYALFPLALVTQLEVRFPLMVTYALVPVLIAGVIRVAGLTTKASMSSGQQRVTWLAIAGLSMAAITASTPVAGLLSLLFIGFVALFRIKKLGYLIWIPLPTAALFGPTVLYFVTNLGQPLGLLAEPGLPLAKLNVSLATVTLFEPIGRLSITSALLAAVLFAISLTSILRRRSGLAALLAVAAVMLATVGNVIDQVQVPAVGVGSTSQSTQSIALGAGGLEVFAALIISILILLALDANLRPTARILMSSSLIALLVVPSILLTWAQPGQLSYSDGRAVPSIVRAEAQAGSALKLLSIQPTVSADNQLTYAAELVNGDGVQFEDVSLSYRFAVAEITNESDEFKTVSQLVADLASASESGVQQAFTKLGLGYILVGKTDSTQSTDLGFALDSISALESVGLTEFGQLWRVREPNQKLLNANQTPEAQWSLTKVAQLAVLIAFVTMALPSRGRARRQSGENDIFVDANEDSND